MTMQGLGWLSIGLGVAGVAAPRLLARAAGVPARGRGPTLIRAVGLRELATGAGLLAQPRGTGWAWARVAGDAMDLGLLGAALPARRARPGRIALAMGAVAGIAAVDVLAARRAGRRQRATEVATDGHAVGVRRCVTVHAPREALYKFWRDFTNMPRFMSRVEAVEPAGEGRTRWWARGPGGMMVDWESEVVEDRPPERIAWRSMPGSRMSHAGSVRFAPAPGGRGTEVTVEMVYTPPGGTLVAALARLVGQAPEQQLKEDLRRFKQLMETGDVMVAAPGGAR